MHLRSLLLFLPALVLALHADPFIHRGINLGNMLEVPPGQNWSEQLLPDYFSIIRQAGFDTIRVPIDFVDYSAGGEAEPIKNDLWQRVDWVIANAKLNQLNVIIDNHTDPGLMDDPDGRAYRFIDVWQQIAERYQNQPDSVMFELLNEPNKSLTSAKWNALLARALGIIRPTNPTRTVIVGPVEWNGIQKLPDLQLPANDQHLLVTVHYYNPMQFTHQGASWVDGSNAWLGTKWEGTDAQKAVIAQDFGKAADWAKAHHRPIFLGEFGAYSKGDMDSRARWTTSVARTAESLGIGWSYWEFCSGFGAYDPVAKQWRQPLLEALVPPGSK